MDRELGKSANGSIGGLVGRERGGSTVGEWVSGGMNQWSDKVVGETRRWIDGQVGGWMDGWMNRQMDIQHTYRWAGKYLDQRAETFAGEACRRAGLSG